MRALLARMGLARPAQAELHRKWLDTLRRPVGPLHGPAPAHLEADGMDALRPGRPMRRPEGTRSLLGPPKH